MGVLVRFSFAFIWHPLITITILICCVPHFPSFLLQMKRGIRDFRRCENELHGCISNIDQLNCALAKLESHARDLTEKLQTGRLRTKVEIDG